MNCPKCHDHMKCSCTACKDRTRTEPGNYRVNLACEDLIACGFCGHTDHIDGWEAEAYKQSMARQTATAASA